MARYLFEYDFGNVLRMTVLSVKTGNPNIIEFDFKATDLNKVFEDYIYKSFISKLDNIDLEDPVKTAVNEYFLKAITESII